MGLLKNILTTILETVKSDEALQPRRPVQTSRPSQPEPTSYSAEPEINRTPAEWHAYFKDILTSSFPQYSLQEEVPVQDMAGYAEDEFKLYSTRPSQVYKAEWGKPYSFVLSQNGQPKGVVMLGSGHSHDSNVKYLIARMYAKKLGLPYINFYTQMPNEKDYVIGRVKRFLPY